MSTLISAPPTRRALTEARREQAHDRSRRRSRFGDAVLWVMAVIGGACILATLAAWLFGFSIINFRTGSMAPTIPAGSSAIVQTVPASELKVDDIVAVDRSGELPITHRIIAIEPGKSPSERIIQMQGDANGTPDPAPYTINSARIVRAHMAGIAPVIAALSTPRVLVPVTIVAAALLVWSFWPQRSATVRPTPIRNTPPRLPRSSGTRRAGRVESDGRRSRIRPGPRRRGTSQNSD